MVRPASGGCPASLKSAAALGGVENNSDQASRQFTTALVVQQWCNLDSAPSPKMAQLRPEQDLRRHHTCPVEAPLLRCAAVTCSPSMHKRFVL